jgi:hypothetical protein
MLLAKDFAVYKRASSKRMNLTAAVCRMAADMQMRETHVMVVKRLWLRAGWASPHRSRKAVA